MAENPVDVNLVDVPADWAAMNWCVTDLESDMLVVTPSMGERKAHAGTLI